MNRVFEDSNELLDSALSASLEEFVKLTGAVLELLNKETDKVGNLSIIGRLVEVPAEGEATVVGDVHGDLETLIKILKGSRFVEQVNEGRKPLLIFLGDYGDRGELSSEVFYLVLNLKQAYPENIILMRGNHEGPDDLLASPHDLPAHMRRKFGLGGPKAYQELRKLFNYLYNGVLVKQRCIMLHGGVPSQAKSIDDLAYAEKRHPAETHLEEILWNDPEEGVTGTYPSPRGAGRLFGEDITTNFLKMLNVNFLIRGHEPSEEGYKINHHGKVLTLFSRKGEPYYNTQAAYLQFDLHEKVENAYQLKESLRFL